ncbi:MAG: Vsr domain protein T:G mismatch repair endonuclease [candidate division WWE3 bacterium GW2011_GWF1_42_14]|uniref:Vsr domain protein T:G mismatch repair endonuclease n=1 Tax=candidate division WWE3 bacterium GW2011_GWF1_42_14 TaxID=1619138 RepID=A0A0G0YRI8_UNCKA|nr:MAG: Vsr domain protein T:G mismatch repair endonuclease [candidate division WWE3 bacterium GW2011_GWA1_42_12]KKS34163.1 MAG: Vsr domain protein T:G mismatch repair endonuclease [candidate division WWE3 bacterium GW2011_GWD1_42_14]KKS39277.1 MAG: Vsr domain protein T:G mismatch repair endonuclease [candidate division WWE3 bacterium GW2011_GWF1_42_14]KKS40775.1 MAG: Vsr domain protein T:G mismatch repair endonuclease [candidate division WWE3 bacterium GW2011_GWE1_42_16]
MARIKAEDTKPEKILFVIAESLGIPYEKHYKIIGKPDVVFPKQKIAVFVDGEFWHGKSFSKWKNNISEFWLQKISDNRKRDRKVNKLLRNDGWSVVRIWGKEITKDSEKVKRKLAKSLLLLVRVSF